MKKMIKYNKKTFSTIELIVSISIMLILGGVVLLNYGLQRDKMELNNAANSVVQAIRKVQGLALGQSARPSVETCSDPGARATNFAAYFEINTNKIKLYVDKDISACLFEEVFFSPRIKISELNPVSSNSAWVSFYLQGLKVKINNRDNVPSLTIKLCVKSSCSTNEKTITVNNKGMVEIQ